MFFKQIQCLFLVMSLFLKGPSKTAIALSVIIEESTKCIYLSVIENEGAEYMTQKELL